MRQLQFIASDLAAVERSIGELEMHKKALNGELREYAEHTVIEAFKIVDKQSGDITMTIDDVKIKAKIPKKVSWDNKILQAVASSMPWDRAQKVFDIKFSVPEKAYAAVTLSGDDELLAKLDAARTVEYGDLKIEIAE